jgi:hypothetical protein
MQIIAKSMLNQNITDSGCNNTYQVVVGYGIAQKFSLGLLDFNRQLEVLAPKPGKGAIENPEEAFNKTDLIPLFMLLVKT